METEDYKGLYEECQLKLAEQSEKFQKRVIQLTNDFNGLKEQNDELILSREKCKIECETSILKYETIMNEKNQENASQKEIIDKYKVSRSLPQLHLIKSKKSRGSSKNISIDPLQCEYTECNYTNVDLVRCDKCAKWVCEESVMM